MIDFYEKHKIALLIGFSLLIAVVVIGTQVWAKQQTFDAEAVQEEIQDLDSLASEESVIIDQFLQERISENYFIGHTQHINSKILSFYQQIDSSEIPDDQVPKIQQLEKIVFGLSMSLKAIESNSSDGEKLRNEQKVIQDFQNQLKGLAGGSR
jgi:hypothetical protein